MIQILVAPDDVQTRIFWVWASRQTFGKLKTKTLPYHASRTRRRPAGGSREKVGC